MSAGVQAAYIQRTITIDGDMSDWYNAATSDCNSLDITCNTNQYSTDAQTGAGDADTVGSTGRDLKKFSYTWDSTYIYFYVERWASSTNVNDWWFYLDTNADGLLQSGEKVFHVNWQGKNRKTDADIYDYVCSTDPDPTCGDPLTSGGAGDGYTMPGGITNAVSLYTNVVAGASSGTEMESRVSWTDLGFSAPANVKFHISSSNGTNLPNNIEDNMDGPGAGGGAGGLFPQDLQVSKTASVSSVLGNQPFTYTITVYNSAIIDFTNVAISDVLPSQVTYVSHTAESGTTFVDTGTDGIPDQWNIPSIPANATYTLTINVKGGVVPVTMTATNTATLTASDQTDEDTSNDSASVDVSIQPVPVLTMVKAASSATADPGSNIGYTIVITNTGGTSAYNVVVKDALSPFSMLGINTYGASIPFQLTDGSPASGVTLGTISYSNDNGATYTYVPVSGGGGAPAGYDANVTNWQIQMSGTMNPSSSNFSIHYQAKLH
jgi:uncharacterized repeat protein (TIGR01451 family)